MSQAPSIPAAQPAAAPLRLRILATTDLHGHLLPYDYVADAPTIGGGLAGLATLVAQARAEAAQHGTPSFLFDNGDTFQGTPLAGQLAKKEVSADHPIVAAFNAMRYDAVGIGNHDLDHGLPYLRQIAGALQMPVLNSNLRDVDLAPLRRSVVLDVPLGPDAPAPLRLGVVSVLPEQSAAWHAVALGPKARIEPPAHSIAREAMALRREGADLIVVLAHMGVGTKAATTADRQAAQALALGGDVDALVLGHTHRRLPARDYEGREGVDTCASTVGGLPAVMAGHAGSDLAVMDLHLDHDAATGWRITGHHCALRANTGDVTPDPVVVARATPTHEAVCTNLRAPVSTTDKLLHSYFSLITPTPSQAIVARAHAALVRRAIAGTPQARLPLLATAPAHGAGGRDGLGNYICIPKGAVLRRHIAGLIPFANQAVGIETTGAELRMRLEHAALAFNELHYDRPDQMLVDDTIPAFQFDTVFGLTYRIDPTAAPLNRIRDLRHEARPVEPDQPFVLATTQFRVAGGGGYAPVAKPRIVARSEAHVEDALIEVLNAPDENLWPQMAPWSFACARKVQAILFTHPAALDYLNPIAAMEPEFCGTTDEGFIRLRITL